MECELKIIRRNAIDAIRDIKTRNGFETFLIILLVLGTVVVVLHCRELSEL